MQTQSYSYSRVIAPFIVIAVAVAMFVVFALPAGAQTSAARQPAARSQASQQAIEKVRDSLAKAIKKQDAAITVFRAKVVASKLPQESKDALTTLLDEYHAQLTQFILDLKAATTMEEVRAVLDAVKSARLAFAPELRAAIDGIKESIRAAKEDCSPRKAAPFLAEMVKEAKTVIGKIGIAKNVKMLGCNLYNVKTKKPDVLPADLSQYGIVIFFGDTHGGLGINYSMALPASPGFLIYASKESMASINLSLSGNTTLGIVSSGQTIFRVTGAPNGTIFVTGANYALSSCVEVDGDQCSTSLNTTGGAFQPSLRIDPTSTSLSGIGATATFTVFYDSDGPTVTNDDNVQVGTALEESVSNSSVIWRLDQFQPNLIKIDRTTGTVTCNKRFNNPQGTTVQVKATYKGAQAIAQILGCGQ